MAARAPARSITPLLLWALAGFAVGEGLPEVIANVKAGRLAMPGLKAQVHEDVAVVGGGVLGSGMQSWGDRSDSRDYDVAYKDGQFYFATKSYFGRGNPDLPLDVKTEVVTGGKILSTQATLRMGEITTIQDPDPCPPLNGFYFEGKPFDEYLTELTEPAVSTDGPLQKISGLYKGVPLTFWLDSTKNWAVVRFAIGDRSETQWQMDGWQELGGAFVPTSSICNI